MQDAGIIRNPGKDPAPPSRMLRLFLELQQEFGQFLRLSEAFPPRRQAPSSTIGKR